MPARAILIPLREREAGRKSRLASLRAGSVRATRARRRFLAPSPLRDSSSRPRRRRGGSRERESRSLWQHPASSRDSAEAAPLVLVARPSVIAPPVRVSHRRLFQSFFFLSPFHHAPSSTLSAKVSFTSRFRGAIRPSASRDSRAADVISREVTVSTCSCDSALKRERTSQSSPRSSVPER